MQDRQQGCTSLQHACPVLGLGLGNPKKHNAGVGAGKCVGNLGLILDPGTTQPECPGLTPRPNYNAPPPLGDAQTMPHAGVVFDEYLDQGEG